MTKIPRSKIYTKLGDRGKTTLFSGKKISKDSPRTKAYGSIDELNSSLGVVNAFNKDVKLNKILKDIQNELFNIGAELANPTKVKRINLEGSKTGWLEAQIDYYDSKLSSLHTFIIPGGSHAAALLHQSRTICRRAEREVVNLSKNENINPNILIYLNRLGDLLFVLARYLNKKANKKESAWQKD